MQLRDSTQNSMWELVHDEIIEVTNPEGWKSYTYKILNHPEDDFKTFHNLVLSETGNQPQIHIMKYQMSDETAYQYYNSDGKIENFKGEITAKDLTSLLGECDDPVIFPPPDQTPPSSGGGPTPGNNENPNTPGVGNPGSGGDSGSSGSSGSTGSSGSNGSNEGDCSIAYMSLDCSCGQSYSSWEEYDDSMCGRYTGNVQYNITISFTYLNVPCGFRGATPCDPPPGFIPIHVPNHILKCITPEKLGEIFPNSPLAERTKFVEIIREYGREFGINTRAKMCHLLSQVGAETGGLSTLNSTENMNYSLSRLLKIFGNKFTSTNPAPYVNNPEGLSNFVYAFTIGNGNESSGDGWRYRGRGLVHITGKDHYEDFKSYLDSHNMGSLYTGPDSVAEDLNAVLSGLWYFQNTVMKKINITELTNADEITKILSPGATKASWQQRRDYFTIAKQILDCPYTN